MKNLFYIIMTLSLVVIASCRKSDNATMPDGIVYINQPTLLKVAGDAAILDNDPLAFKASFSIDLYFKDSEKPQYLDIVVIKNEDPKSAKVVKANVSSFPAVVEITGQQLIDLFGGISSGDNFDFGADYITSGGNRYRAFPLGEYVNATGETKYPIGYGAGVSNQVNTSTVIRYSAICGLDIDEFVGRFEVTEDSWADFGEGTIVEITKVSDTKLSMMHVAPGFLPIVFEVNSADNSATISSFMIATAAAVTGYYGGGGAYGSLTISTGGASSASFVNPCNNEIQLNIQYVLSNFGNQGAYALKLKKVI